MFFDVTNRLEIVYVMFFLEVDHIFYCKHYIKKCNYTKTLFLAKKYTLQHLKISAVSVFDPMTSLETTITYSKDKRTYIIGQFQGEGFK